METLGFETVQFSPMLGAPPPDFERQLRGAAAAGFDWFAVDIWSIRAFEAEGHALAELADIASSCELECGQLQTLTVPASEPLDVLVDDLTRAADTLHPATVQVVAKTRSDDALHNFKNASSQIRNVAPDSLFAFEYTPIQDINSIKSTLDFIRDAGVERCGLNLDTWHFFQGGENWSDLEGVELEDIVHLQISDHGPVTSLNGLRDEMMHRRVLPGDGVFDLDRFLSIVRSIGYRGRAGVEILSEAMREMNPEDYAAEVHRRSTRYWGGSAESG